MALLTKPGTITKGTPTLFQIDKTEVQTLVPSGHYFEDILNWKKVVLHYQSADGSQNIAVTMDMAPEMPEGYFNTSIYALDVFEIQYMIIWDFDNGKLLVLREDLPVEEFDVDMSA